jgi:hypothetical protein
MVFYLGTHEPSWLVRCSVPLMVSRNRLARLKTLPAAATVGAGTRAAVTDANATTFNSAVVGGNNNTASGRGAVVVGGVSDSELCAQRRGRVENLRGSIGQLIPGDSVAGGGYIWVNATTTNVAARRLLPLDCAQSVTDAKGGPWAVGVGQQRLDLGHRRAGQTVSAALVCGLGERSAQLRKPTQREYLDAQSHCGHLFGQATNALEFAQ